MEVLADKTILFKGDLLIVKNMRFDSFLLLRYCADVVAKLFFGNPIHFRRTDSIISSEL
jgi:hypothetical protein